MRTPRLWKFAALPFLINAVLYTVLAVLLYLFVQNILLGEWLANAWAMVRWVVAILAYVAGGILLAFTFTAIGHVVAAPLLDLLAERVLTDLRQKPLPPGRGWLRESLLAIGRQFVKLLIFGTVQIGLLALWLLPGGSVVHGLAAVIVTIFFLALEYFDYPLAADRFPLGRRYRWVIQQGATSWGFGSSLLLLALIPVIGYVALPACVTGATLLYYDLFSQYSKK